MSPGLDLRSNAQWPLSLVTYTVSSVSFLGMDNEPWSQTIRHSGLPSRPCAKLFHLFKNMGVEVGERGCC